MQYITSENLNLIIENREKLIQSGLFDPWEGKVYFDMALVNLWQFEKMIYHCPENPNILFAIYYPEELWWENYYAVYLSNNALYIPIGGGKYAAIKKQPSILYYLKRAQRLATIPHWKNEAALGNACYLQRRPNEALAYFEQAMLHGYKETLAHFKMGLCYLQKREAAAARDCFRAAYEAEENLVQKSSYLWQCVQCGVLLKAQSPALYGQFKQQLDRIVQDYPLMSLEAQDMAALELLNGIDAAFWFEDYEEIMHLSKVLLQLGLSYMLTADERRMVDTAQALQSHLGQPDARFRAEYRQGLEQDTRTLYFQIWQDGDYFELP